MSKRFDVKTEEMQIFGLIPSGQFETTIKDRETGDTYRGTGDSVTESRENAEREVSVNDRHSR